MGGGLGGGGFGGGGFGGGGFGGGGFGGGGSTCWSHVFHSSEPEFPSQHMGDSLGSL